MTRATVIIVNWNGERFLGNCLEALSRQTVTDFETWVVDNASSDGSVTLLEQEFPTVRVLRNDENRGFAGGNNTALREVATPYAVLLNNDATPEPDWLANLLAPFDSRPRLAAATSKVVFAPRFLALDLATETFLPGGGDPRDLGVRISQLLVGDEDVTERVLWEKLTWGPEGIGEGRFRWTRPTGRLLVPVPAGTDKPHCVTVTWAAEREKPVTLSWDGGSAELTVAETGNVVRFEVPSQVPLVDVVNNVGSVVFHDGYGADLGYQQVDAGQFAEPQDVFAMCGCAVAMRTEAGQAVGWFDEDFFLYYEDCDLSWRLRMAGWDIAYEPSAVVRHIHSATSVEWSPTFVFHTDRNRLLMLTKDASAARALREVMRYPLTTASITVRTLRNAAKARSRPHLRPLLLRLCVIRSFVRLLPTMLLRRRALRRAAVVSRRELETWLVERS
ncbi:MAG: glycosyl transferase family 2 [Frankiales bacterium]|nr:glycosyl transferase family 2 [Frankiales bacterium]